MELILYQFETCPFCARVRSWLEAHGVPYTTVEVPRDRQDPLRQELAAKSGVATVPVLRAGTTYIGDSERIISWLRKEELL